VPKNTRFGAFFRAKRNALGLNLREFCRRNGFDPGNVSRLERGLLPPPKSAEILKSYAQALKLRPDDWQTFEALAVQESIPSGFRTVRRETRRVQPLVSAADIQSWADLISARSDFPRLIRRLIHATAEKPLRVEFPAGEGSQRSGWDGTVNAPTSTEYVPAGPSSWELGVGANPARKAEDDFQRRTKNPLDVEPSLATFVFVTPRRWNDKAKWEAAKKKLGIWKDVRVLDADSIEAWLELAPAVDIWFARLLGRRTEGTTDVDDYWANLAATTKPKLTPKVFLTPRRNDEILALGQWLGISPANQPETGNEETPPTVLSIQSGSPIDAIDFLAAYVANLDDAKHDELTSRILIVDDMASWNTLSDHQHPLTLVPKPRLALEAEAVAQAVRKGHRVLLGSERFAPGQFQPITLSRPDVFELTTALTEAGLEEEKANKHALDCSGSLTVLKRRLASIPATAQPEWARSEIANQLAPLILIGCWQDVVKADTDVVARVTGKSYAEVADLVNHAATLSDAPLFRVQGLCSLTSREDSWLLLGDRLREDQLATWNQLAVQVLTEDEFENRPRRRTSRKSKGQTEGYSESLRTGIAETLALRSAFPTKPGTLRATDSISADYIVSQILGGNPGWKRWAALSSQLPLLAEAAPDAFLNAIESELRVQNGTIVRLFQDHGDTMFSPCLHAGFLWALETLAWHPPYLLRVSLVLAELSQRDPGGRWSNRPASSLGEIFLPWLPHTAARVDERIKVIRKITEKKPDAGWRLLISLLPAIHAHSMPTHTPRWRNWAANWRMQATDADFAEQVQACADRLVEMVGNDPTRWTDIISHIGELPSTSRSNALSKLVDLDASAMGLDQRKKLAKILREQIYRHKAFPDAFWSMPDQDVNELEAALARVEPDDPVVRSVWLFADHVELPDPRGADWSWDENEKKASALRQGVVRSLFAQDGMDGLLRLATAVKAPWLVGVELANTNLVTDSHTIVPSLLMAPDSATQGVARGYVLTRFNKEGWAWVHSLSTDSWSPDELARFAALLSAEKATWDWLKGHSDAAHTVYWKTAFIYPIKDRLDLEYAVTQLLAHQRPFAALQALHLVLHCMPDLPADLLFQSLEATLKPNADQRPQNVGFDILDVLQNLQGRKPPVDQRRLAQLEWTFIELLDGRRASATTLHTQLANDPAFFAELFKLIFRPRTEIDAPRPEPSEQERRRALNIYRLLHSWEQLPGFESATQTVQSDSLLRWVKSARELCRQSGHLEICDIYIGQILARSPEESDGTWPCVAVRDAIETIESDDVSEGFVVGTLNRRGVVMRRPTAGGDLERGEAAKYASYAKACETDWPLTASILRKIAEIYEGRARDEDAGAELRRLWR
jgi:transcriptional regulator with XRE-family HTH domain